MDLQFLQKIPNAAAMNELFAIAPALTAPFIGSFLGVLILRLPAGLPVAAARSRCDHCAERLTMRDLVPLLSWLVNRARCRHCAYPLSAFYPGIELAAVLVALWAATQLSGWLLWAGCGLGWSLLALSVTDQRAMILPDALTLPLIPAGLTVAWAIDPATLPDHVTGMAVGFATLLAIRGGYRKLRGREGLGLGDVKLMAAAGAWLSWQALPSVLLTATVCGLALVVIRTVANRPPDPQECIPFGPCICLAIWSVWLYGPVVPG